MTSAIVPFDDQPSDNNQPKPSRDEERRPEGHQRRDGYVLSSEQCMMLLSQIPGLVKAKIMAPAEANSIRPTLQAILAVHQANRPSAGAAKEVPAKILDLIRENPDLQVWFEPLLSDSDIDKLARGDGR